MLARYRGYYLMEALITIVIFSLGLLGIINLYGKLHARGVDAQLRLLANNYANEYLSMMVADNSNASCYSTPVLGACGSLLASNFRNTWVATVQANLPGSAANPPVVIIDANNRVTITINWQRNQDINPHNHMLMGQL